MRYLFSSFSLIIWCSLSSQNFCYTTEMQNEWFSKHPELKESFERSQKEWAELDKDLYETGYQMANKSAAAGNYTIPIVFHILHLGGAENISDAQVIDAVNILTRDFNAANADTANVVVPFKNKIGNAKIDFILATKDPNGNCTNGIIRHYDANTDWSGDFSNFAYTWPRTRYLNIYVVRTLDNGAAGYTFLPGSGIPASMDAIVILNGYVGSIGTGNIGLSRALTHEVGHWLNLPHVWGSTNQPGVACGDDGVSDTPITKGYSSCNLNNAIICTPGVVENVQNYMEYAYCQRMYTTGQAVRMQNLLNSPTNGRNNLSTPGNLSITGITNPGINCIPQIALAALPSLTVCSGKSLTISGFTFNAVPTTYLWSADNAASVANPTAASTSILFTNPGITNVSCQVSNANGSSSETITINVLNGVTEITSANNESFEASTISPPVLWKLVSPTSPAEKWEILSPAGSEGIVCMYAPGETLNPNSEVILESPSYDFKNNPGAQFSFKYAYAMQSATHKDIFKVQASRNCGGSWSDVWVPSSSSLSQNSGGITSELFYPNADQWKFRNITQQPQFLPFASEEHVLIRFYFKENVGGSVSGNRFYLDEVSFAAPVGINELTKSIDFNVYPNPASTELNIGFNLSNASKIKYQVTSISGSILINENETVYAEGAHEIKIDADSILKPGIYFLSLELNGVKMSKKIVIE